MTDSVLLGTFRDVKGTEWADLSPRHNLRHDFGLVGLGMDHHNPLEVVSRQVATNLLSVSMLSLRKPSVQPMQIMIEKSNLEIMPREQVYGCCTRLGELSVAESVTKPRNTVFAIVEDKHRPRLRDVEGHVREA